MPRFLLHTLYADRYQIAYWVTTEDYMVFTCEMATRDTTWARDWPKRLVLTEADPMDEYAEVKRFLWNLIQEYLKAHGLP